MSGTRKRKIILVAVIFLVLPLLLQAAPKVSIRTNGRWRMTIGTTDLTGGAGSDFPGFFESALNEITIDITKLITPTTQWRLDVRRVDSNWHANLRLYVLRTTDGTGDGTISGGAVYQEVTTVDQSFFTGMDDRNNITLQLRLEGMPAQVPEDTYLTDVYYTVTEL